MAQIKVTRKAYVRKDSTVVKGTSYYTKDKGKPGKTPESEKWYQHSVEMNWHKDEPAEVRRANALKAHKGDELATARALQALANVTTDPETSKLAKTDVISSLPKHQYLKRSCSRGSWVNFFSFVKKNEAPASKKSYGSCRQ